MISFRKNVLLTGLASFLLVGCYDENKSSKGEKRRDDIQANVGLVSRSLIRYDSLGKQILDEFENIDGGDVEVCLTGPLDRNENESYFLISEEHYKFLCIVSGKDELKKIGYSPSPLPYGYKIKNLRVVVMDREKQEEINKNYSNAR